jgi:hypothetical protein
MYSIKRHESSRADTFEMSHSLSSGEAIEETRTHSTVWCYGGCVLDCIEGVRGEVHHTPHRLEHSAHQPLAQPLHVHTSATVVNTCNDVNAFKNPVAPSLLAPRTGSRNTPPTPSYTPSNKRCAEHKGVKQ